MYKNKNIFKAVYIAVLFICSFLIAFSVRNTRELELPCEVQEKTEEWGTKPFEMYPGEYTVTVEYSAKKTVDFYFCTDYNKDKFPAAFDTENQVFSFPVFMTIHSDRCHIGFPDYNPDDITITGMMVSSEKPLYYDRVFYAFLLFVSGLALLFVICSNRFAKLSIPEKLMAAALLLSVLASCIPLAAGDFINGWDVYAHRMRIDGIFECLKGGQFPAVIYPKNNNGFGQLGTPYPQLFLYPPAVLRMLRISAPVSMHFYYLIINIATAVISYVCGKAMFKENIPAFVFAVLFELVPYRLMDIYNRCALGETTSLTFVPLILAGFYLLSTEKQSEETNKAVLFIVAGATGIIDSHILSPVIIVLFAGVLIILNIKRLIVKEKIAACLKALGWIVLINLFILVPIGSFLLFGLNSSVTKGPSFMGFTTLKGIFTIRDFLTGLPFNDVSVIGLVTVILGAVLFVKLLGDRNKEASERFFIGVYPLMLILTVFTLVEFPWEQLREIGFIESFTDLIQFRYRFMIAASVLYCFVLTYSLTALFKDEKRSRIIRLAAVLLAFICVLPSLFAMLSEEVQYLKTEGGESLDSLSEYFPEGADSADYRYDRLFPSSEELLITDYEKNGTKMTFGYATSGNIEYIDLPVFYYPGYTAVIKGGGRLETGQGVEYRLRVNFPENSAGEVTVMYKHPWYFVVSYLISLAAAVLFVIKMVRSR